MNTESASRQARHQPFVFHRSDLSKSDHVIARHVLSAWPDGVGSWAGRVWAYSPEQGIWSEIPDHVLEDRILALDGEQVGKYTSLEISDRKIRSILSACRRVCRCDSWPDSLAGVAFRDVFVSWRDGALDVSEHDPVHRATAAIDLAWSVVQGAADDASLWSRTIAEILEPDGSDEAGDLAAKIAALEEWIGVALLGMSTQLGKALVLLGCGATGEGTGGTGKSTLIRVLESLWSEDQRSAIQPQRISHERYVGGLVGSQANLIDDADTTPIRSAAMLKSAITGGIIEANPKGRDVYKFRPVAAHAWALNERFPCTDAAVFRRLLVLTCEQRFADTDREIIDLAKSLIEAEREQIVARCIRAGVSALSRGKGGRFTVPACHTEQIAAWKRGSSPVPEFVASKLEQCHHTEGMTADEITDAFNDWARQYGLRDLTPGPMGRKLHSAGFRPSRDGIRRYGLRFKREALDRWLDERVEDADCGEPTSIYTLHRDLAAWAAERDVEAPGLDELVDRLEGAGHRPVGLPTGGWQVRLRA